MIGNEIIIEDTTLRDGEQAPGLAFSPSVKLEIYQMLVNCGLKWIEVGIPAMGGSELSFLKTVVKINEYYNPDVNLIAWNRGKKEDIKQSIDLGYKKIHIGLPTSDIHLQHSIGKDKKWLINAAKELIDYAKQRGCFVSISAEDVGRTEIEFLEEYARCVEEAGADRLRLSDTIGILNPAAYSNVIKSLKKVSDIPLQCHAHNDFGLAVANTLSGLDAGAKYFHVTVNGIGERAGMPDLCQMTLALKRFYNVDVGIETSLLKKLSQRIALLTNTSLYPWQPITGDNVFSHESGIHANGTLKHGETFEPFPPELVDGSRHLVLGKHSGTASIKHLLKGRGINVPETESGKQILHDCLSIVRESAIQAQTSLSCNDLVKIYNEKLLSAKEEEYA